MPSLITASWAAWGAANLPGAGTFAADDLAGAIVKLGIRVPPNARTADTLGTEREGTGVLIDAAGHILTIGYLVRVAQSLEHPPLAFGDSSSVREMNTVAVAAHAGAGGWSNACVVRRRPFT